MSFPLLAFISGIGGYELLGILAIVLLLFGPRKLPELARGLGKSIKEFKKAAQEVQDDFQEAMDATETNKEASKPVTREKAASAPKKAVSAND